MSTKQEIVSGAAFKVWPFSFDFNFACKNSQVTAATCKFYCPFFFFSVIYQFAKSTILNKVEFWDPSLKWSPFTKTSQVLSESQPFSLLFLNAAIFIESHCVFQCYFLQHDAFQTVATTISFLWIQSMAFQSQNYLQKSKFH